jgi:hypothetical protein
MFVLKERRFGKGNIMPPKIGFVIVGLLLVGAGLRGAGAEAAPINTAVSDYIVTPGAASVTPVRWVCSWQPGSGMGRQCRWVEPGWRWQQQRCWAERIPGSGLGPQRVCR